MLYIHVCVCAFKCVYCMHGHARRGGRHQLAISIHVLSGYVRSFRHSFLRSLLPSFLISFARSFLSSTGVYLIQGYTSVLVDGSDLFTLPPSEQDQIRHRKGGDMKGPGLLGYPSFLPSVSLSFPLSWHFVETKAPTFLLFLIFLRFLPLGGTRHPPCLSSFLGCPTFSVS